MLRFNSRVKMPENKMRDAALALAEAGYFVFPCAAGTKRPACANGVYDATTDPDQIRRWWTEDPQFNVAVSPSRSGCFVLDEDPPLGAETLANLELEHGLLPRTLTIQTPRGGFHYWFKGECKTTVGTATNGLGPKLDTRGQGGYVLMPPSIVNGKEYTYENPGGISDGPEWIAELCGRSRHDSVAATECVELDTPGNVERARNLLQRYRAEGRVAVEGAGGDDLTYRVCAEILNLGLTAEKAWQTLLEDWNPACVPPWSEDELAQKVRNAAEYAQNEQGAWAVPSGQELFSAFAAEHTETNHRTSRFRPLALNDVGAFREPSWLIPGLIPQGGTVQITGQKKSFKTFLTLDIVLGIAAGVETFGHCPVAAPVVYVAGENAGALALNHVPAWALSHQIDWDEMQQSVPFWIVPNMVRAAEVAEIEELIREIKAREIAPAVVVIDTATRALRGLDENSAKDMGIFSAACEHIQRELNCTVIVIRHAGKDASRGGRGSNVLEGDFDTVLDVERHEKSMFVALTVKEQRNAAEREEPFTFEGQVVGPSLAFRAITPDAWRRATRPEDVYAPTKIGAALRGMGAIGEARAVTTAVLAAQLVPQLQDESPEDRAHGIGRASRALKALARGRLQGYALGDGAGLRWCLPDAAGE